MRRLSIAMVTINKLRFEKKGAESMLSPLECDALNVLWPLKEARVREIHKKLKAQRKKVALTSVAVILDRLHSKGIVARKVGTGRGGEHYVYSPVTSREGFEKSVVECTVNKLIDSFGPVAVSYFNERFSTEKEKR